MIHTTQEMWDALKERVKGSASVSKSLMNDPKFTEGRPEAIAFKRGMASAYDDVLEMMFLIEPISKKGEVV